MPSNKISEYIERKYADSDYKSQSKERTSKSCKDQKNSASS